MSSDRVSVLTVEDCQQILDNCFQRTPPVQYVSHRVRSLSGDVEGYLSEHYALEVSYIGAGDSGDPEHSSNNHKHNEKFFVKCLLKKNGFLEAFSRSMDVFSKEAFIYTRLFREFEGMRAYRQIAPRIHLCKDNVLVLEDLIARGYKTAERLKQFSVEQCRMALEIIAQFHAYTIIHEERMSRSTGVQYRLNTEFAEEFAEKFYGAPADSPTTKFIQSSLQCILDVIDVLPEDRVDREEFKRLLVAYRTEDADLEKDSAKYRFTCVHGDLWANNIMFKSNQAGQLIDCKLVDFQMMRYCLPAFDVELFFYGNTSVEFRRQHRDDLLQYYYKCLTEAFKLNDLDVQEVMSYQELVDTCILKAPEAKTQAISDMSLLYLSQDLYEQAEQMSDFFKTLLVDERSKYILNVYHDNEQFRSVFTEELLDLKGILEAKQEFLKTVAQCE